MNRIDARFAELKSRRPQGPDPVRHGGRSGTGCDGAAAASRSPARARTCIEIGVPFSDPMADGPVIQHANERALAEGVGLTQIFGWVAEFRKTDAVTPIVLMGYLNPVEIYGYARFAARRRCGGRRWCVAGRLPPRGSTNRRCAGQGRIAPDLPQRADHVRSRVWPLYAKAHAASCTMSRLPASPARTD